MFYYFDDITKIEGFDFDSILLDEKSYKNIQIYDISYKTLTGAKPYCIRIDKVDGFIRVYDGTTILHRIFEANSSFNVKQRTMGKAQFLLVLTKFSF